MKINILINIPDINIVAKPVAIQAKLYQKTPLAISVRLIKLEYFIIAVELIANGKVKEAYIGVKFSLNILNIAIQINAVINNPKGKRKFTIIGLG